MWQTDARSGNCTVNSLCHDVISLVHYDACFLVCRSRAVSWSSSDDLCRSVDAQLTRLLNADIYEALLDDIRGLQSPAAEDSYWIGLRKARWVWNSTGTYFRSEMRPGKGEKVKYSLSHGSQGGTDFRFVRP